MLPVDLVLPSECANDLIIDVALVQVHLEPTQHNTVINAGDVLAHGCAVLRRNAQRQAGEKEHGTAV